MPIWPVAYLVWQLCTQSEELEGQAPTQATRSPQGVPVSQAPSWEQQLCSMHWLQRMFVSSHTSEPQGPASTVDEDEDEDVPPVPAVAPPVPGPPPVPVVWP